MLKGFALNKTSCHVHAHELPRESQLHNFVNFRPQSQLQNQHEPTDLVNGTILQSGFLHLRSRVFQQFLSRHESDNQAKVWLGNTHQGCRRTISVRALKMVATLSSTRRSEHSFQLVGRGKVVRMFEFTRQQGRRFALHEDIPG